MGLFTTHGEMIKYFNETGYLNYLYQNELDRSCFAHSNCSDLTKRTISDKILKDRAYEIAINSKYDGYKKGMANIIYMFFE